MLKTIWSTGPATNSKKTKGEVGGDSIAGNIVGGSEAIKPTKRKNQVKITKFKILIKFKNHEFPKSKTEKAGTSFFTPKTRLAFT